MGALNSLTQVALKATMPGVPDFYQGTEFWDLSLVDPDNRRPVDFAARAACCHRSATPDWRALAETWRTGASRLRSFAVFWRCGSNSARLCRSVPMSRLK